MCISFVFCKVRDQTKKNDGRVTGRGKGSERTGFSVCHFSLVPPPTFVVLPRLNFAQLYPLLHETQTERKTPQKTHGFQAY